MIWCFYRPTAIRSLSATIIAIGNDMPGDMEYHAVDPPVSSDMMSSRNNSVPRPARGVGGTASDFAVHLKRLPKIVHAVITTASQPA
jgi:hypothetical protein